MTEPIEPDFSDGPGTIYYEVSPELEAAQIAKLQAETREALARAVNEEQKAVISGINRAERERTEALNQIQDHYVHHYYFAGEVDDRSVFPCLSSLAAWHRKDPTSPMDITINSPGGSVVDGMHLFDEISKYSIRGGGEHKVTITVRGEAASMAGILLQAADERVMGPRATLLIHEISSWTQGSLGSIKDDVKRLDMMTEQVIQIFLERSKGKISRETFQKSWERRDWWLNAKESLDYGFVDRIG